MASPPFNNEQQYWPPPYDRLIIDETDDGPKVHSVKPEPQRQSPESPEPEPEQVNDSPAVSAIEVAATTLASLPSDGAEAGVTALSSFSSESWGSHTSTDCQTTSAAAPSASASASPSPSP